MHFDVHPSWLPFLKNEITAPYFKELGAFLDFERKAGKEIFPAAENTFHALKATPFHSVKVVILGQDPYHGEGQAHGLSFSVQKGVKLPPSLVNIYKELGTDLGLPTPAHGNLETWAAQGVLLLNSVLTVEKGKAGSHHKQGWEQFTDRIVDVLNEEKQNLVFILWGAPAQKKAQKVNPEKHLILSGPHPSPLSSYRGFFGSRPFSQANAYLKAHGMTEIDWKVT